MFLKKLFSVLALVSVLLIIDFSFTDFSQTNASSPVAIVQRKREFYSGALTNGQEVEIDGFLVEVAQKEKYQLLERQAANQGFSIKDTSSDIVLLQNALDEERNYGDNDLAELSDLGSIEFIEPNFIYELQYTPNDPIISSQWWINDTSGADVDIQAYEMWDIEQASQQDIVVGVIDTGVSLDHADLTNNLVDGYDFSRDQIPAYDYHGHGTHVAGIIAAEVNNTIGVAGVSGHNNLKVMPLRVDLSVYEIIEAIEHANANGVKVLNMSLGGYGYSQSFKDAIDSFDGLVIASAANEGGDNDGQYPIYPASYDSINIIAIAAVDEDNNIASFSNYGAESVDVAAPGVDIASTYPQFISASEEDFSGTVGTTLVGSDYINDPLNPIGEDWVADDGLGYILAGDGTYAHNQDNSIILETPIDTSGSIENPNLEITFSAAIEYSLNCTDDYLAVYIDDNDDNWTELVRYCGTFDDFTTGGPDWFAYDIDLGVTYANLRVKLRWVTDGATLGSRVPTIDSLILRSQSDVTDIYGSMSGTSMAAPVVSGLAGLVYSKIPDISPVYAKYLLTTTGDAYLNSSSRPTATNKSVNGEELYERLETPADGSFTPETWLESSVGELSDATYPFKASGDFNGDGVDELIAMKKLSSTAMELWVYPTHGNGTVEGEMWSSFNPWYVDNTLFMDSGDFNNDGLEDIFVFYKYNSDTFAAWVFVSDGTSFTPERWMTFNPWYIDNTEFITIGDYNNDNLMDIGVFYKYSDTVIALWVFESNGTAFVPERWYVFDPWYINSTKFVSSGDYNGDGFDDMAAFYTYNSTTVAMWVFESNGVKMTPKRWQVFNPWYVTSTKEMTTGDFNGDGNDDLGFYYTYGSDTMALWVYESSGSLFVPRRWNIFAGVVTANIKDWIAGDYLGSGVDAILGLYDNGYNDVDMVIYR